MSGGILFVCLGNICRSPLAEAVARAEFARLGLAVPVASAGTGDWHVGGGADPRALAVAAEAGYDLGAHRARQVRAEDFARYERVLAMDRANLRALQRLGTDAPNPPALFLEYAGFPAPHEVPDPYTGSLDDFRAVLALVRGGVLALARAWGARVPETAAAALRRP
ncbi:protein tyrosine phosphatase [Mizugakiibacter sediminis]|uniref:protein-tyrosine-phosphatase n=1 Tax=Mizugakiibacter sediminis TaxID=1475481 RepID=A0A0K8QJ63_9GAMM|nr:low molecular weight protein-tyrosine-phosphatase [Mizugakiibacter sediminis]GAP64726.1 protein tyrosine phosphatase [Mizugakiibacter sediminis]